MAIIAPAAGLEVVGSPPGGAIARDPSLDALSGTDPLLYKVWLEGTRDALADQFPGADALVGTPGETNRAIWRIRGSGQIAVMGCSDATLRGPAGKAKIHPQSLFALDGSTHDVPVVMSYGPEATPAAREMVEDLRNYLGGRDRPIGVLSTWAYAMDPEAPIATPNQVAFESRPELL